MPFVKRLNTRAAEDGLTALAALRDERVGIAEQVAELDARRDAAVREASAAGATRRVVAEAAGISPGRVHQIVAG